MYRIMIKGRWLTHEAAQETATPIPSDRARCGDARVAEAGSAVAVANSIVLIKLLPIHTHVAHGILLQLELSLFLMQSAWVQRPRVCAVLSAGATNVVTFADLASRAHIEEAAKEAERCASVSAALRIVVAWEGMRRLVPVQMVPTRRITGINDAGAKRSPNH
jgi:hypothetical protein